MVEIKILCSCGTKYKFEVEPVNNQLPKPVACPNCGADGTAGANAYLASLAPAPSLQPEVPAGKPGLSISKPALSVAHPEPSTPPPPPPAAPAALKPAGRVKSASGEEEGGIGTGVVGALIGGAVGMLLWYGVIRFTGYEIGWIAWGVGGLTGFGAKLLTKETNQKLGLVAVGIALVAILGGEWLGVRHGVRKEMEKFTQKIAHEINFEDIKKEAEKLGPNPTEQDIRKFIADEDAANGGSVRSLEDLAKIAASEGKEIPKLKPEDVTKEELADFKKQRLELLRDVAAGKLTEEAYKKRVAAEMSAAASEAVGWKESFSLWTILWLFLGLGSAWKLATGQDD